MTQLDALGQVAIMLVATGAAIAAVELFLYWLLYKFEHKLYWPVALAMSVGAGTGLAFWVQGEDPFSWWGPGVGLSIGLLGALWGKWLKGANRIAVMMLAPAFLAVVLLIIYPFFFQVRLAFANLNLYTIGRWLFQGELSWVGFDNFIKVFTSSPLQTATFWDLLGRTFLWTGINLVFHVGFGLGLAMLLNRSLRFKGVYRTLLVLPWAMPQVVAILAWRGEFHPQFGFVNHLLELVGFGAINWWSDPIPVFISCCIVNIWLGIPFMMVVFLGGLQSIPHSYYEAASIDGASKLTQFFQITLPMLKPVVVPSITLGTIWTFNNINVIYLMTGQDGGNEHADILVSALYKSAFTYSRFSFSAAFALIIFAILIVITMAWMKISRGTESAVS